MAAIRFLAYVPHQNDDGKKYNTVSTWATNGNGLINDHAVQQTLRESLELDDLFDQES
jgi:hypothetical protein